MKQSKRYGPNRIPPFKGKALEKLLEKAAEKQEKEKKEREK